jgi:hypothetical protein
MPHVQVVDSDRNNPTEAVYLMSALCQKFVKCRHRLVAGGARLDIRQISFLLCDLDKTEK